jgi:hypothetical protein
MILSNVALLTTVRRADDAGVLEVWGHCEVGAGCGGAGVGVLIQNFAGPGNNSPADL